MKYKKILIASKINIKSKQIGFKKLNTRAKLTIIDNIFLLSRKGKICFKISVHLGQFEVKNQTPKFYSDLYKKSKSHDHIQPYGFMNYIFQSVALLFCLCN